ncbi:MAG: TonB-dependent receptor [Proteobacteria bacterium]|nr:TonB-dependent receptor [Pseudomonadota bacterium]
MRIARTSIWTLLAALFLIQSLPVRAAEKTFELNLPPTAADVAIKALARETGHLALFQSSEVTDIQTNAVIGRFTLRDALGVMLNGTPLEFELTSGGVIVLSNVSGRESGQEALPPIDLAADLATDDARDEPEARKGGGLLARIARAVVSPLTGTDASATSDGMQHIIEEIVVTAEKREEELLDVPLTMSALDNRLIEELGITNARDLEQMIPGLQFGSAALQQRSDGQGITIRGIGTQSSRELHSDLAVAVYIDGVYTVDTYGLAPNLFDVERVEVARGPQGTLNGRNSIAGSISFHSKRPTDAWDTEVLAELTDQTTRRLNLALGGPLTDEFSIRVNGGLHAGDGSQENTGIGTDYGAPDQRTFSPQMRWRNDMVDLNLKYLNVRDQGSEEVLVRFADIARDNPDQGNWFLNRRPMPSIARCADPPITGVAGTNVFQTTPADARLHCDRLENKTASNLNGNRDSRTDRWTLNLDLDLTPSLTLRYTWGQSATRTAASQDNDGTDRTGTAANPPIPSDLNNHLAVDCPGFGTLGEVDCWLSQPDISFADSETVHQFENDESSHEIQLLSDFDGRFNFVLGLYAYQNETLFDHGSFDYANPLRFVDVDAAAVAASPIFGETVVTSCESYLNDFFIPTYGDPSTGIVLDEFKVRCPEGMDHTRQAAYFSSTASDTMAAFVNVEFELDPRWNLAGGLRWTKDDKRRTTKVPRDLDGVIGQGLPGTVPNITLVGDFFGTGVPVVLTGSAGPPAPDSWAKVIGHISVEYSPRDKMMYYARISTGYRAGGFNFQFLDNESSFEEEDLINFELGQKGLLLGGRLQLTTGVFYQDFRNYQLTALQPVDPRFIDPTDDTPLREHTINVGDSTSIYGLEIEGIYQPGDRWRISGYYNYLGSRLGRHSTVIRADPERQFEVYRYKSPDADPAGPDGIPGTADDFEATSEVPIPRDHTGDELPQMPNHKFAVTAAYTLPLDRWGAVQFLGSWSHTGERWPQRAGNIARNVVPSYERLDLRANWRSADGQWSAAVYMQNVFDEIGVAESISIDLEGALTEPRQAGLQVRWRPVL